MRRYDERDISILVQQKQFPISFSTVGGGYPVKEVLSAECEWLGLFPSGFSRLSLLRGLQFAHHQALPKLIPQSQLATPLTPSLRIRHFLRGSLTLLSLSVT